MDSHGHTHDKTSASQLQVKSGDEGNHTFHLARSQGESQIDNKSLLAKIAPTLRKSITNNPDEPKKMHQQQERNRRKNDWKPSGTRNETRTIASFNDETKPMMIAGRATCPLPLKKQLPGIIKEAMQMLDVECNNMEPIRLLDSLHCSEYFKPDKRLLRVAYNSIGKFMTPDDYECFEQKYNHHALYQP